MSERGSRQLPDGVTIEQFVIAWQTSDNTDDVLEKLGLTGSESFTRLDVSSFAGFLRRHDVKLKKYTPRRGLTDYNAIRSAALKALGTLAPSKE